MIYIFDACAMIALLRKETGEAVVAACLADNQSVCFAHALNLCEVYYDFYKAGGASVAELSISELKTLGVTERNDMDETFWKEVGRLKANHRASLADLCAVALTNKLAATLLTSDHHELDALHAAQICPIQFIR